MCSFLFLRLLHQLSDEQIARANAFAAQRGPDFTSSYHLEDKHGFHCTFLHNLLDMSGYASHQPIISGESGCRRILLFNGEIYNHAKLLSTLSDTLCLLPLYDRLYENLGASLDGEYAIVIYDEKNEQVYLTVDPFLTKPLFIGTSKNPGEFGIATCASSLRQVGLYDVTMVPANSFQTVRFNQNSIESCLQIPSRTFDLAQKEITFQKWENAFLSSVEKRATHGAHPPCVFLSSGYDSGAICLALNLLKIPYTTMSILGQESESILRKRIRQNQHAIGAKAFVFEGINAEHIEKIKQQIRTSVEPFEYQHFDSPGVTLPLWEDGGAIGAFFLAEQSRQRGFLVNLSGSGADEIISDYGFDGKPFYYHSQFGGRFPENLEGFFPWKKFYGDTQRSYLFKDEYVLGRFGIEGRYPFLDHEVVQCFLSLAVNLKNSRYKAPIAHFLEKHGYPFEDSIKRGFSPQNRSSLWRRLLRRIGKGSL
jgi:asparagine synthetase B (glutamine-hydrolysing)